MKVEKESITNNSHHRTGKYDRLRNPLGFRSGNTSFEVAVVFILIPEQMLN